jgi:antitoxin VapB
MKSAQTTIFKSNRSQAVRLPKDVALPESVKRVHIVAVGNTRVITPAGESWDQWFNSPGVAADFMDTREQPEGQKRPAL